jgi:large subunit ribosomal protein L29
MADYLRANDARVLTKDDRTKRLKDLRQELMHERGVAAMGGSPPSPGKIRQLRRQIARILTIEREDKLGIKRVVKATTPGRGPRPARAAKKEANE